MKRNSENSLKRKTSCKHYLKGKCSFGDKCYFFHAPMAKKLLKPEEFSLQLDFSEGFEINEKELRNYNIELDIPFKMKHQDDEVVIIRHGLSQYNFASNEFYFKTGISFTDQGAKAYQTNRALIDSDLHPYGEIMSERNSKNLHKINFATVFVSPLGRALQTAHLLFKSHPNHDKINFIVLPELSEILSKVQDISDIRKQIRIHGNEFDFSRMEKQFGDDLDSWQLAHIKDENRIKLIEDKLKLSQTNNTDNPKPIQDIILSVMNDIFPSSIERVHATYDRAEIARNIIKQYIEENKIDSTIQKIALVSHNAFIQSFTAKGKSDDGFVYKGESMKNCEIQSIQLNS